MSYNAPSVESPVTLNATAPQKIIATPTANRAGWRCYNPSRTAGIFFYVVAVGATAPTLSTVPDARVAALCLVEDDAKASSDVYAMIDPADGVTSLIVQPEQLV